MEHLRKDTDTVIRIFLGRDTTQHDAQGRKAVRSLWYWEPIYYDGEELFSEGYNSPAAAAEAFYETV
jgi:hypothetical protein